MLGQPVHNFGENRPGTCIQCSSLVHHDCLKVINIQNIIINTCDLHVGAKKFIDCVYEENKIYKITHTVYLHPGL